MFDFMKHCQMDGKVNGLNLIGRKRIAWLGSGITLLVNGMEMPMIKVTTFARLFL